MGDRTLTHLLEERVEAHGDRTFLVFEDREGAISEFTYRDLHAKVERCAAGLAGIGVGHGDFVVVHLANCPEFVIAWFALARLGATLVPSNVANTGGELEHILTVTEARHAITEPALMAALEEGIARAGADVVTVVVGGDAESTSFAELLAATGEAPRPKVGSTEVAELIFTSGTTRKPKAVMLTHAHCLRAGLDDVHCLWLDEGERCLTALPLFHVNAQAMSLLRVVTLGGTLVGRPGFPGTEFSGQ